MCCVPPGGEKEGRDGMLGPTLPTQSMGGMGRGTGTGRASLGSVMMCRTWTMLEAFLESWWRCFVLVVGSELVVGAVDGSCG